MAKFSFPVFNSITFFKNSGFICSWISFVPSHFMIFVFGCNTRHSNVISLDKFLQVVSWWYSIYVRTVSSYACCLLIWTGLHWFMNHWYRKHVPYSQFLPRPARKESNIPKLKSSQGLIYILCLRLIILKTINWPATACIWLMLCTVYVLYMMLIWLNLENNCVTFGVFFVHAC